MLDQYSSRLLAQCVEAFSQLPGVGQRTALRYALHLLRRKKEDGQALAQSISQLVDDIKYCKVCHNISDTDICEICSDSQRNQSIICVVENIRGVMTIESTGIYHGLYHVLGGIISPIDGIGPDDVEIDSLVERVAQGGVSEVIFALNPTMEGDTTIFYISRKLAAFDIKMTTLARGVSVGDDLEYADEITLGRSIVNRVSLDAQNR
ncbi:MAG: recombination protein RecR [Alloprevotella sp.]|nr:recombination protein RecR [Alloprevotella sp.]